MMNDERCPECSGHMYPFDVTCDDCYFFTVEVIQGCYIDLTNALHVLGYRYGEFIEKSKWLRDRLMLKIKCPRKDNEALRQILDEITSIGQK